MICLLSFVHMCCTLSVLNHCPSRIDLKELHELRGSEFWNIDVVYNG